MTRHETLGMNRIFENIAANDGTINVVIRERNMAVNKIVQQQSVDNQNAFWHGIKSVLSQNNFGTNFFVTTI